MKVDIILGRIFLAIISCITVLILLEYGSRLFFPDTKLADRKNLSDPVDAFREPKPYVMFGGAANAKINDIERLNENGYRGKPPSKEKIKGEYRIFLLGGSTVVLGDPPLNELIEGLLRKTVHRNISVFNYGVLSSVSGMELSRIIFEIADYNPDLIVMYSGANDLGLPPFYDPRPGFPFNFMVYGSNPLLESDLKTYPTLLMTLYGSNLVRRMFPNFFMNNLLPLDRLRKEAKWETKEWEDRMVLCYVKNLSKAATVSKAFGAQFIALYQPVVYYKNCRTDFEDKWVGTEIDDYYYMRDKVNSTIAEYQKEKNINFVDVSNIFASKTETIFTDRIHITQAGNNIVALELFKHILPLITK